MMMDIQPIMESLAMIEGDSSVPKNVRAKIKDAMSLLLDENGKSAAVKIDQVLQHLDELNDDPNLPPYTRTQIWNVVSTLSRKP
ncbi:UPF0147 family protein [Candidatus Woesearchaeota archaeon]|nr:UPF0147 family protein [Candidatus Woesearchaeota archaeon]